MRLKPGQLCTLNGTVYRAKKKTAGCEGCHFNRNVFMCPAVTNMRSNKCKLDCQLDGIILQKL
jgi:hypothetical protein